MKKYTTFKVQVSLELNVIETNQFFLQKEGVNQIMLRHKIRTQVDHKSKNGGHHHGTSLPC